MQLRMACSHGNHVVTNIKQRSLEIRFLKVCCCLSHGLHFSSQMFYSACLFQHFKPIFDKVSISHGSTLFNLKKHLFKTLPPKIIQFLANTLNDTSLLTSQCAFHFTLNTIAKLLCNLNNNAGFYCCFSCNSSAQLKDGV